MTILLSSFAFVLIVSSLSIQSEANEQTNGSTNTTLKFVVLIHRHGDRSPISTYPRDPYRNESKYWPDGWGQLTLKGKDRMYKVGKYLAKRYGNFLGQNPKEVYIRSSGSDRCLESVSAVLAGLYPPVGRWKWNSDIGQLWQPFPIQTVPHDFDGMLNPGSKCKKGEQEIERIYKSPEVLQFTEQVKATLQYTKDNTGEKSMDLIEAEELFDVLFIEKQNNLSLPPWADKYVYARLKEIAAKTFVFEAMTKLIQKLRAGLLLKDIVTQLKEENYGKRRLHIYSTHDTQLSVFLAALNAYNNLLPPFGASILMEVHQEQSQEPFIKLFYLNVTETESPYELELKDCLEAQIIETSTSRSSRQSSAKLCTVSRFFHSVREFLPDNWEEECDNVAPISADVVNVYILITMVSVTLFVLSVFMYLFVNNRRHANLYKMLPIN